MNLFQVLASSHTSNNSNKMPELFLKFIDVVQVNIFPIRELGLDGCPGVRFEVPLSCQLVRMRMDLMAGCELGLTPSVMGWEPNWRSVLLNKS